MILERSGPQLLTPWVGRLAFHQPKVFDDIGMRLSIKPSYIKPLTI